LPVEEGEPRASLARYRSVVFEEAGTLLHRAPPSSAFPSIVEMEVASGDQVRPVDHPEGGVYGRILVFADSVEDLDEAERRAREALDLQVVPSDDLAWAVAESREFKSCC